MPSFLDPSMREEIIHGVIPLFHRGPELFYSADWLDGMFAKYAPELWAQQTDPGEPGGRVSHTWDQLLRNCFFDFTVFTNNSTRVTRKKTGVRCLTPDAMFNAAKGLCNISGGTCYSDCRVKIYSVVDNTISTIERMGGYNKFFEILTDGVSRGGHEATIYDANPGIMTRLPFPFETMQKIYQAAHNVTPVLNEYSMYAGGIWISVNRKRGLYRLPATSGESWLPPVGGASRWAYNRDTEAWSNDVPGVVPNPRFLIRTYGLLGIPLDHKITDANEIITGLPAQSGWNPTGQNWAAGYSSIICYGLETQGDPNWISVYIKPYMGMDTFTFPKFDPNEVRLEMIASVGDRRDRFYYLDTSADMPNTGNAPLPADPNDSGTSFQPMRLRRSTILGALGRKSNPEPVGSPMHRMSEFRFYFRRVGTPFVSRISPYYLQLGSSNRNILSIWDMSIQKDR